MDEGTITETFLNLVKIDSPSGFENQVVSYLSNIFTKLGLKPTVDSFGNLIVKIKGSGETLLLSAHMDTVEPGSNIRPKVVDGIIKSSGDTILGADNKVAVAAILEVIKNIQLKHIKSRSLEIIFTTKEEVADAGALHLNHEKISAKSGYIFDHESPIGTIITASPFYNGFDIEIIGISAHASMPEKAINALTIFEKAIGEIKLGRINAKTLVNIGTIQGGSVKNAIPGNIKITGEVRSFLEQEVELYSKEIVKAFEDAAKSFKGRIRYNIVRENPGYEHSITDSLVKHTQAILQELEIKTDFKTSWGCSDANIFNQHGIKTVNLGNGSVNSHTVNEYIKVSDLERLPDLIFALVASS